VPEQSPQSAERWTPGPRPDDWRERWDLWQRPGQTPERIFGDEVRRTRDDRGLSRVELTAAVWDRTGIAIHPTAIAKFEVGEVRRTIRLDEAAALALVLGLDLAELVGPRPYSLELSYEDAVRERDEIQHALADAGAEAEAAQQRVTGLRRRLEDVTATIDWLDRATERQDQ
jgi:hypothetical protein